jgi:hypothetical protein
MPRPFGRRETSPVGAHPLQASTEAAETAFAFLSQLGFVLDERWITGGESFRDGWRLSYSSSQVQVVVQYLDSQFEVSFTRSATTVTYLTIDQELFDRRSGYHGDMFRRRRSAMRSTRSPQTFERTTAESCPAMTPSGPESHVFTGCPGRRASVSRRRIYGVSDSARDGAPAVVI